MKKISYIIILALLLSMITPVETNIALASNSLLSDVSDELSRRGGQLRSSDGSFSLEPTNPLTSDKMGYMTAKRSSIYEWKRVNGELKYVRTGKTQVDQLYATTASNYAKSNSTLSWRTVAYKYDLTDSGDYSNVLYTTGFLDYLSLQKQWVDLVKSTNAYRMGYTELYDRMTIPASTLTKNNRIPKSRLDTAEFLIQSAKMQIYNPQTGQVYDEFIADLRDSADIQRIGAKYNMQSQTDYWLYRSQIIQLFPSKTEEAIGPDFTPVPEKTIYEGNPGDEITVKVDLKNIGTEEASTDFGCIEEGKSWAAVRESDKLLYEDNINLRDGGNKTFSLKATVPEIGRVTRLEFTANTTGWNPSNELELSNNKAVVTVRALGSEDSKASLELSQKRITKAFDLNNIGGLSTFTFTYGSTGYHYYTCESEKCKGHRHARSSAVDANYNYWVDHRNQLNALLLGTVNPFSPNYNCTDTTKGVKGDFGKAKWSGGAGSLTPNMSYVIWRGKDMPTLASYKESPTNPLISLGLSIGKTPVGSRTDGGYTDNFIIELGENPYGDYYTSFQCSHGDGSVQSHSTSNKATYDTDVNILSFLGVENTGNQSADAASNSAFKVNGMAINNAQTGGKYGKASGFAVQNSSNPIVFHPYVQMAYDYPYNKTNPQMTQAVNVLAQHKSTFVPVDFVNTGWVRSINPTINISSNQWLAHQRAAKWGANNVLPGGAIYQLNTKGNSSRAVVSTWQTYLPQEQLNSVISDGSYYTLDNANNRHKQLAKEARDTLNTVDVEQYVDSRDNVSNAFGGSKVKGKGQSMNLGGRTFTLSSYDKHHLVYGSGMASKGIAEADIDILGESNYKTYYKVSADINGNVIVQKSSNGSNWITLDTLPKSQDASSLGNPESIELNNKTKVVTNLINALDRNKGNDPSVGNGPQWYNEAWDGICVVKNDTVFDVGLGVPANRISVLDPKLTPPQASQYDLYTKAYASQFRLNAKSYLRAGKPEGYIGTFAGVDVIMPEMVNMQYSRLFYIPSGTVKDNIYTN